MLAAVAVKPTRTGPTQKKKKNKNNNMNSSNNNTHINNNNLSIVLDVVGIDTSRCKGIFLLLRLFWPFVFILF